MAGFELCTLGIEGTTEHHLTRVLGNVDESAGTDRDPIEFGDIDISLLVNLTESEECRIQASSGIEVELRRCIDHTAGISGIAEQGACQQFPPVGSVLNRLVIAFVSSFCSQHRSNLIRDAESEVDHVSLTEFGFCSSGNGQPE